MLSTRTLNMASLRYDKRMLYSAVLRPLQHFKLELGRRLTAAEVAQIKVHLKRDLQNDILLKVTDGEDLILLLDQYFGVDNIRLLERLLSLIECYDLLNALLDWKETDYPAKPEVFYECNYFPLWVKIVADISWFFQNRKGILRSLKILLEIPEIEVEDEDLDPLVLMSVTSSKRSTLICTLLPVSMRRHVKVLLRDTDVGISLERLRISGIYFSRKVGSHGGRDDLSVSSSILSLTDHFDEDRPRNGVASYTHQDTPPANFHDAEYYYKPVQHTDQFMGNGSERSPSNYGFVEQDRSPPHTSSLHDYTKQPDRIFPSDEDPHPKVVEPKLSSDVSTPRSQASSEGVVNRMMRVRPQMAYINHEVYKVQTHSVVESAYKDETCAQPEEGIFGDLRDHPVEENVVLSETSTQAYCLYEPLFSEQTQVDGPGKSRTTSSELPSERKVSLTNGKSYVSKLVIAINGKNSEPRSYSAEVFQNNSDPEVEKGCFEDTSYSQIYDDPISNDNEPRLVQRKDFSLVEQAPPWDGSPGHFEENSQVDFGDWYEGNGDTNAYNSQRMQPEPETTDFPEGASRFLEDDQFRMMQPEPEQNFFEVEGDFAATTRQDYADIPQRGGRPPKNSEVEIVRVRSKVLEHHQPQQTRQYHSDGSVNSFDEGAAFNSNFLHPVPLTLPRIAPEQQDSNFFPPPRNQIPHKELQRDSPSIYRKHQDGTLEGSPRLPSRFMRGDADLQSDYADSVFTDTTSRSDRDGPSFAPPPYNPPPDYKFAVKKKKSLRSVEGSTTSTGQRSVQLLSPRA